MFGCSTIRHLEEVAGFCGPEDDKAKVPIGLTASQKQVLLAMHAAYKFTQVYHDFLIAKQNKLVPSAIRDTQEKAKAFSSDAVTTNLYCYSKYKTSWVQCISLSH